MNRVIRRWPYAVAGAVGVLVIVGIVVRPHPGPEPPGGSAVVGGAVTPAPSRSVATLPSGSPAPSAVSAGPSVETSASPPSALPDELTTQTATTALQLLNLLPVQRLDSSTGYSREQFGQTWSDDVTVDGGHNGCDTRNDILRRDLTAPRIKPGTHGCVVLDGTLDDQYTGQEIMFVRGPSTSDQVQIDHLVALSDAWQTGAQHLSAAQRQDFANDPVNLQAVTGTVNAAKGDNDAAGWLPPNPDYRCDYVSRQVQVKTKYSLWVTPGERDAITATLDICGATAPTAAQSDATAVTTGNPPTSIDGPARSTALQSRSIHNYFQSCAEARAARAAPLTLGQPGYRAGLDGDLDGIACEPPR